MTARDQSDAVALAVDHWPSRTASKGNNLSIDAPGSGRIDRGPFVNRTFVKNCIASGSLVPPAGEGASVRRTDYMVGLAVLVLIGLVFISVAFLWRA